MVSVVFSGVLSDTLSGVFCTPACSGRYRSPVTPQPVVATPAIQSMASASRQRVSVRDMLLVNMIDLLELMFS